MNFVDYVLNNNLLLKDWDKNEHNLNMGDEFENTGLIKTFKIIGLYIDRHGYYYYFVQYEENGEIVEIYLRRFLDFIKEKYYVRKNKKNEVCDK